MVSKPKSKRAEKSEEAGRCDAEGQTGFSESGCLFPSDGTHGPLPPLLHGARDGTSPRPSPTPSLPPGPTRGSTLWPHEIRVRRNQLCFFWTNALREIM